MAIHNVPSCSTEELKALRQLLDLAVRHGGLSAAPAATVWLQRVEMAERAVLPMPNHIEAVEADSHGSHFPPQPKPE